MSHVIRSRVRALPAPSAAPPRHLRLVDAEAIAVLHRAAQVLMDDLAGLTSSLVAALREQEPAYRAVIEADPAEVWQEIHRSLRHSVGSLLRPRESRDAALRTSWRIAEYRAEQGMPLDALLHAFRLGGAIVWQGLVDETARRDPEDVRLLVHVVADVWNFVDEHCSLVAEAYRRTERQLAWRRENRLRLTTAALLDGTLRITDLPDAAAMLDLPEHARYAVVAVAALHPAPLALPPGTRAIWHASGDEELAIVLLGEDEQESADAAPDPADHPGSGCAPWVGGREPDRGRHDARPGPGGAVGGPGHAHARPRTEPAELAARLAPPPGVRVGVSSAVTGLAALGDARRLAGLALRACARDGGVVILDEHLPAALVVSSPALGTALAERVLGPLDGVDPTDRELLVETLTVWLDEDGSAQRAAARLYCHRNTVLNRLRRFEQLTGRSLSRPSDAVEVSLALTARRLLDI
ncbi:PucR family transcriptional regulator [Streptomyces sp. NPDC002889]|uniref:PucR family transcriptional regulator n=1 Tax=Streptomyces sp. NPDC002889 TaxID=3364669 RepID=UPI0036C40D79